LDEDKTYTIVPIASVRAYRKAISVAGISIHTSFLISKKSAISASLLYRYDLQSDTKTSEPFIQQKNTFSPSFGWIFFIQ
jgi:hypothetical protein